MKKVTMKKSIGPVNVKIKKFGKVKSDFGIKEVKFKKVK